MDGGEGVPRPTLGEIPHPEAPDGIAIIGPNPDGEGYLQHYFDSRGVARIYGISLGDSIWTVERNSEGFSPLHVSQRYHGTFSADGARIEGAWETCHHGSTWGTTSTSSTHDRPEQSTRPGLDLGLPDPRPTRRCPAPQVSEQGIGGLRWRGP